MVGIEGLSDDVIFTWLIEQCRDPESGGCIFLPGDHSYSYLRQKENNSKLVSII